MLVLIILCFSAWSARAQQSTLDTLVEQFNRYQTHALQEKVFVHTDRSFYMSGEVLWCKLYLVDGLLHQPLSLSKVAYIEVLDTAQTPVLQSKIALEEGQGSGSFYLPVSTLSGHYVIRAYTNWMKNFAPDFYYEQPITIVNPFSSPGLPVPDTATQYDVRFFPEGGNLVYDLESKVAFKATDTQGNSIDVSGFILNQHQDTITRFRPLKFGMGHFSFTPEAGNQYRAVVAIGDTLFNYKLPTVYPEGYVMKLTDTGQDQLTVSVQARGAYDRSFVYLLAHTRQSLKVAAILPLNEGEGTMQIDKQALGEGISHFTVFDGQARAVCERLYFKIPSRGLDIQATINQPLFRTRESATVQLQTSDDQEKLIPAHLSMAVYRIDTLAQFEQPELRTYMWLTSDLKGKIESPDYYFTSHDPDVDEATDNLMLTQGWRRFKWEAVMQPKTPDFTFIPEYEGPIIQGKVLDFPSGEAMENRKIYLTVPGAHFQFYGATIGNQGTTEFITRNIFGTTSLYFHTNDDSISGFEISSPFSDQYTAAVLPVFDLAESNREMLEQRSMSMQVQNVFAENKMNQFVKPPVDGLSFYGVPDRSYLLDDYTRFPTMEEVMREYIREVAVRKQQKQYHYKVLGKADNSYYDGDPLVLLDGMPLFDINQAIALDPLDIKKIDVVQQQFVLHKSIFSGIVSYTTYQGDFSIVPLDPQAIKVAYDGLQQQREFYMPQYETEQQLSSRMPDFRVLLYWAPTIETGPDGNSELHFYTSDQPGTYVGTIQGMSDTGAMGRGTFTFEVKGEPLN
ncbi:MAG: hypothetical protein RIG62_20175 [Cyclobacteriaceae bacterium]